MKKFILLVTLLSSVAFVSEAKTKILKKPVTETLTTGAPVAKTPIAKQVLRKPLDYYAISWEHCGHQTYIICETIDDYNEMSDALWDYYCCLTC
jgi:hypothetical protein